MRRRLPWHFGEITFQAAIEDIQLKVKDDVIYCKVLEKTQFLHRWLPQIIEIDWIPAMNKFNNCMHKICERGHSSNCARRKVYEMQYADKLYHDAINKISSLIM